MGKISWSRCNSFNGARRSCFVVVRDIKDQDQEIIQRSKARSIELNLLVGTAQKSDRMLLAGLIVVS